MKGKFEQNLDLIEKHSIDMFLMWIGYLIIDWLKVWLFFKNGVVRFEDREYKL